MTPEPPTSGDLCELLGLDPRRVTTLVEAYAARGWTVATAESLTAGLLAAVLTEVPGSSAVIRGGIVCYATDLKASLLGVDAELLARVGPVDPQVARQLAVGARRRCAATVGVGLTGVAGPAAQGGRPPGTVYVAVADDAAVAVAQLDPAEFASQISTSGETDRSTVRAAAVRQAISMLEDRIAG